MAIDKNLLRQISAKTSIDRSGIASLSRGIHRLPELREWVTLETIAMSPVPVQRLGEWALVSLLTVLKKNQDVTNCYLTPWAVVEWSLSTMQVTKKIDLRSVKENNPLWKSRSIVAQPADLSVNLNSQLLTLRENNLFSKLDKFCSDPSRSQEDFAELAQHYSGILPKEFYLFYHDLVPESKQWLIADVPAITLEIIDSNPVEPKSSEVNIQNSISQTKSPSDLTNKLSDWLQQCTEITKALPHDLQDLTAHLSSLLTAIDKRRILPGFRLAFVGEFSRGKSHLINRLLGREILPEGALPTTATLTSIVAGLEERMEVRVSGKTEVRYLDDISWEDLLATDDAGSETEVFAGVRISLNHQWLKSLDIEIIDTPGAGDLSERRINMVSDILNQCDGAILTVSANSPFSMTEAAFLEQEVLGRHIPRVMVAVSKLDTILPADKANVMNNIRHRIANTAGDIPVLSTHPIEDSLSETDALATIIAQIESLVDRGERRIWRSRQVSDQLSDWLGHAIEIFQGAIAAMTMTSAQRKDALRQAENEIEQADLDWDNLRIKIDTLRLKRTKEIHQQINSCQQELIENLEFEIQKVPDLKIWWERDLPFRLRRELTMISRRNEGFLIKLLTEDIQWLQCEVAKIFSTNIQQSVFNQQQVTGIQFKLDNQDITDLQKYRLFTRLGTTAAMIGGSILGGPIGIAASTGILLASEGYLNKELDVQRLVLSDELKRVVDISINEYCQQVSERLRQLYQVIIDDIVTEQTAWKYSKKASLTFDESSTTQAQNDWQQVLAKAVKLQQEIISALSN
jgi:GTPase SAR1 family protein